MVWPSLHFCQGDCGLGWGRLLPAHLPGLPWVSACRGPAPSWGRLGNPPGGWVTSPSWWSLRPRWSRYPVCPAVSLPLLGPPLLQLRIGPGGSGKPSEDPCAHGEDKDKIKDKAGLGAASRGGAGRRAHILMSGGHLEAGRGRVVPHFPRPAALPSGAP